MVPKSILPPAPPVGTPVQFFSQGDKDTIVAAICVDRGDDSRCKLNLFYPGGGEMRSSGEWVLHVNSPEATGEWLRTVRMGTVRGTWDYLPGWPVQHVQPAEQPPQEEPVYEPRPRGSNITKADRAEGIEIARDMFKSHPEADPEFIFRRVRPYGVKKSDIEELAPKLGEVSS